LKEQGKLLIQPLLAPLSKPNLRDAAAGLVVRFHKDAHGLFSTNGC
jgi:hypothetical protein